METRTKEVFYDIYCKKCKYYELEPYKNPCNECLAEPYNMDVCRPFQFTRLMAALSGLLMIQIVLMIFCILTMPNMFWPNVSGDLDLMIV